MARKQTTRQKQVVGRVMHAFKHGALDNGSGGTVRDPRQAVAIGLKEAGASSRASPNENRRQAAKTELGEPGAGSSGGGTTRAELYQQAKAEGVPGRSRMSKAELERVLARP